MKLISQDDFKNAVGVVDGEVVNVGTEKNFEQQTFGVVAIRTITATQMRDRFTFDERKAIKFSSDEDVQTFKEDLSLRTDDVDLDSDKFALAFALLKECDLLITKGGETIDERIERLTMNATKSEIDNV